MSTYQNVLLIGASGALGAPILRAFLSAPQYKVSILSRLNSTSTFPADIPVFKADYNSVNSLLPAMRGQDVVICMVGGQASGDQNTLIDAALTAGVKRFIPSEFGPYSPDPELQAINPHANVPKTKTVEYLKKTEARMSWTSLVTGGFFDWAMKVGFSGFDLQNQMVGLIDDGTQVFTATLLSTIGKALIAVLEHAGETRNQYVIVSSFNVSQRDILEVLERVSRKTWKAEHLDSGAVIASGERRLREGDFAGIMDLTRGAAFGRRGLGDERKRGFWNDRLGLAEDDLDQAVRQVLQEV